MSRVRRGLVCSVLIGVACTGSHRRLNASPETAPSRSNRLSALAQAPLAFEANRGQADRRTAFVARGLGYAIEIESAAMRLHLARQGDDPAATLEMRIVGASPKARVVGRVSRPAE